VGARNDDVAKSAIAAAETIIVAWGQFDPLIANHCQKRLLKIRAFLCEKQAYAVGKPVGDNFPRHGRMWNGENRKLRPHVWI
jgi:hypothetical protein